MGGWNMVSPPMPGQGQGQQQGQQGSGWFAPQQQQQQQRQPNALAMGPQGMSAQQQPMTLAQMGQNMGRSVMSMARNIGNFFTGGTNADWDSAPGATSYDTQSKQFGYPTQAGSAPGPSASDTGAMEAE
jgi:hypothetical protein